MWRDEARRGDGKYRSNLPRVFSLMHLVHLDSHRDRRYPPPKTSSVGGLFSWILSE